MQKDIYWFIHSRPAERIRPCWASNRRKSIGGLEGQLARAALASIKREKVARTGLVGWPLYGKHRSSCWFVSAKRHRCLLPLLSRVGQRWVLDHHHTEICRPPCGGGIDSGLWSVHDLGAKQLQQPDIQSMWPSVRMYAWSTASRHVVDSSWSRS